MAAFKVGDRVRVVSCDANAHGESAIGHAGTIDGRGDHFMYEWTLKIDDLPSLWFFDSRHLAPLTPPAEDAWAADAVRKVTKPQHVEPEVAERLREFDSNFTA
jgi:hypothetical protein